MNIDAAFPSKYLKAADLGAARPVVTIASVSMEEVGDDKLPVLKLVGKDKAIVLNRTNANMIAEIAGTSETDAWRGVRIQLYATKTDFGGKRVDCVRIEMPTSGASQPASRPVSLPPMPAPLPNMGSTPGGWASTADVAKGFASFPDVGGAPLTDDDIPF